jgi:hemin uptake protein HemP
LIDAMVSDPPPTNADIATPQVAVSRTGRQADVDSPRVVSSEILLAGQAQLAILHNETIYFLRQTRFGKLILTK